MKIKNLEGADYSVSFIHSRNTSLVADSHEGFMAEILSLPGLVSEETLEHNGRSRKDPNGVPRDFTICLVKRFKKDGNPEIVAYGMGLVHKSMDKFCKSIGRNVSMGRAFTSLAQKDLGLAVLLRAGYNQQITNMKRNSAIAEATKVVEAFKAPV